MTNPITKVETVRVHEEVAVTPYFGDAELGTLRVRPEHAAAVVSRLLGAVPAQLVGEPRFDGCTTWRHAGSGEVWLMSFGDKKINVIKCLREVFSGMGLKEAKELVESSPACIERDVTPERGRELVFRLAEVGATAEVRP